VGGPARASTGTGGRVAGVRISGYWLSLSISASPPGVKTERKK
jgi:hypothetical protein